MSKDYFYGLNADGPVIPPLATPRARADRSKLRELVGVLLCLAFVAAIVGLYSYSRPARAEEPKAPAIAAPSGPSKVARSLSKPSLEPVVLRIYTEAPCAHKAVVKLITRMGGGPMMHVFKAASVLWEGKHYAGCWIEDRNGDVLTIFEDNSDLPPIPMRAFRDESL